MIKLSNGHSFEHMAASGALGFDGLGWPWEQPLRWGGLIRPELFTVVAKTLTRWPQKGNLRWYNPFACVRFIPGGVHNAVGLANPGIEWWCKKIGPKVHTEKIPLVVSLHGAPDELAEMAGMLNDFDLVGLEINASCPNVSQSSVEEIVRGCEAVKKASRFPLIIKVAVGQDVREIVGHLEGVIEAISINSVPYRLVYPGRRQNPLARFGGGGLSGKIVQPFTWGLVRELASLTKVPIIGPSIWDFEDMRLVREAGAKAVSFGSIFLRYPWRPISFVLREMKEEIENV